jgi:hypothetical protein
MTSTTTTEQAAKEGELAKTSDTVPEKIRAAFAEIANTVPIDVGADGRRPQAVTTSNKISNN